MEAAVYFFGNVRKVYQLKEKNSEIKDCALCLGNIAKDFTINIIIGKKLD